MFGKSIQRLLVVTIAFVVAFTSLANVRPVQAAGGKIVFTSDHGKKECDQDICHTAIYLMNADGSNQQRITGDDVSFAYSPDWSPDGKQIVFAGVIPHPGTTWPTIYTMNADGSNLRELTDHTKTSINPKWSPDGTRIAFAQAGEDTIYRLKVMNTDGSNVLQVGNVSCTSFAWSPDSQSILANGSLYNLDGTERGIIGHNIRITGEYPAWSPNGMQIAGATNWLDESHTDIYLVDVNNADNPKRLTSMGHSKSPTWSPDGRQIAFSSYQDGHWQIYVMNADGSNLHNITNDGDNNDSPAWQR